MPATQLGVPDATGAFLTFFPSTFSRGALVAVLAALACLAAPVAGAGAQTVLDTTIESGPLPVSDDTTPEFVFSGTDAVRFECRTLEIDTSFDQCVSPVTLDPLDDGVYVFEVRGVDMDDNPDTTPASQTFRVDTDAPDTTIVSGPTGPTNDVTPAFAFTSSEAGGSFDCWVHKPDETAPGFAPCSSGTELSELAAGDWVFEVRAVDMAMNPDDTPDRRSFSVDTTAADTTIVSGPTGLTNDATPDFAFTSTEAGGFECRQHLVGGTAPAFAPCTSPHAPGPLGDGSYVFEVRAVDAAGNSDATPARSSFQIDTTPPETTITGGPGDTTSATAAFLFSAPGAARFSCRLDGGSWHPCASPQAYSSLSLGSHRFEVTAVDEAGNEDPTPAQHAWQVLRPGLVIPSTVTQAVALAKELVQMRRALARIRLRTLARRRSVLFKTFDALTAGTVEIRARTRVRGPRGRRWIGVLVGEREVSKAGPHRVRAKVTKKGRGLARRRKSLPLELRLSFTDLAGRSLWATAKVTLKR